MMTTPPRMLIATMPASFETFVAHLLRRTCQSGRIGVQTDRSLRTREGHPFRGPPLIGPGWTTGMLW
jgi:hypothetical protein